MALLNFSLLLLLISSSNSFEIATFQNISVLVKQVGENSTKSVFVRYDEHLGRHLDRKSTETLVIENQFIPKLAQDSLSNFSRIQNLHLAKNGIRDVQPGAFRNVINLQVLDLSKNQLEDIKNGVFSSLKSIQFLYLDNNKITRIGHKAFNNLQITHLNLQNNHISRWNREWFTSSSVQVLNFANNSIEELPPNLLLSMSKPSREDMTLIFSNNRLHLINIDVFNGFHSFMRVDLDGNCLERLKPGVFNGVNTIKVLNLNNNTLYEINVKLLKNVKVEILMLEDNKLTCLSTDLFKMEELDIDGNPITCTCVKSWLDWRGIYSYPSIYHITNLEQECI